MNKQKYDELLDDIVLAKSEEAYYRKKMEYHREILLILEKRLQNKRVE